MAIESSAFPFPSEIVMAPAGYNAARGHMSVALVILAGVTGSLTGALVNYGAARWLDRWLRRYGHWLLIRPEALDRAETFFLRHGEIGTFIGRLVPVVRQLISIPAGMARMRVDRFVLYTGVGAGVWCLILTWIGWAIGRTVGVLEAQEVHRRVTDVLVFLLPALATIALIYVWWYRRRRAAAPPRER
jgi:membrane protein DedA with SNARE-associated domain